MIRVALLAFAAGAVTVLWLIARSMGTAEDGFPLAYRDDDGLPATDPYVLAQAAELLRREGFG